jgi:hypothetical protein
MVPSQVSQNYETPELFPKLTEFWEKFTLLFFIGICPKAENFEQL